MFPRGKRVPAGGRPGDTFTYYPDTKIEKDNSASIHMIFDQALVCLKIEDGTLLNNLQDAIMMLTTVKRLCPPVVNDIVSQTEASQLDAFGDLGGTMFYCENYMSPQHPDPDASWCICTQLEKICLEDEFNFALTEWGIYYTTAPGAVW